MINKVGINFYSVTANRNNKTNTDPIVRYKPASLSSDRLELSFKGRMTPGRCQEILDAVVKELPGEIMQRIIPKIKNVVIADTLAKALKTEVNSGHHLYEELPEHLMQLGDNLRAQLPQDALDAINLIASDNAFFRSLPKGKSMLALSAPDLKKDITEPIEGPFEIETVAPDGSKHVLPPQITDTLLILRDLDLNAGQQEAFLRSLTGAADDSELKGLARVDDEEIPQLNEAEKDGKFVACSIGKDNYSLYISTNNGEASDEGIKNSLIKAIARIIINDYGLDYNREISEAFNRDVRVHNIHRAVDKKLKGAKDSEFASLREIKEKLTLTPFLASKPDSTIGIVQALEDVVVDITAHTNRHDPTDKDIINQMYSTLYKAVQNVFCIGSQKMLPES